MGLDAAPVVLSEWSPNFANRSARVVYNAIKNHLKPDADGYGLMRGRMQRNPALIALSREHLPALILAYRLRHGRSSNPAHPWPTEPSAQRSAALAFIHGDLARHFAAEEAVLLPLKEHLSDPGPSERVWAEHQAFWQQVQAIEGADPEALPPLLQALGELLEAHVRFEERVWFEQLQSELPPSQLAVVMADLEVHLSSGEKGACAASGEAP